MYLWFGVIQLSLLIQIVIFHFFFFFLWWVTFNCIQDILANILGDSGYNLLYFKRLSSNLVLSHKLWPAFLGCGSNNNLFFKTFPVLFWYSWLHYFIWSVHFFPLVLFDAIKGVVPSPDVYWLWVGGILWFVRTKSTS